MKKHRMAKSKTIISYRTYMFKDKDPIIDKLRTALQDSGLSYEDVHAKSGISTTTLYSWFHGKTRRPQFATIAAAVGAMGKEIAIVDKNRKK